MFKPKPIKQNNSEDMVKSYYAIYKCPMCGKQFRISDKPFNCKRNEFPEIIARIVKNQQFIGNSALFQAPIQIPHKCDNGNAGIATLIGFMDIDNMKGEY